MKTILLFLLAAFSSIAMAEKMENSYALSGAGGIASPSYSMAVFQNPAGISYIPKFNINFSGGANSSFQNPIIGGGLMYGGGNWGIVGGLQDAVTPGTQSLYFGLAGEITAIKTSLGVSGTYGINPSGGLNLNAGILITPVDKFRLGFTAFGLNNSISELGAGLNINLSQAFSFMVDASSNTSLSNINFCPGLTVADQNIGATLGYGFGNASSLQIMTGFSAGAFAALGKTVKLELYYNRLQTLFGSLTIHL